MLIRIFGPMIARPTRLILMAAFAAVVGAVGVLLGRQSVATAARLDELDLEQLLAYFRPVVLGFAVPILALVTSAGGLAEMIGDKTLVYVWLRPVRRSSIAVGAWFDATAVAIFVALPLSLITVVSFILGPRDASGQSDRLFVATIVATLMSTAAYVALFVLLNVLTRFGTLIGTAYVLLWELFLAPVAPGARWASIGHYATSFIGNIATESVIGTDGEYVTNWVSATVLAGATIVFIALTSMRLQRMSVA